MKLRDFDIWSKWALHRHFFRKGGRSAKSAGISQSLQALHRKPDSESPRGRSEMAGTIR